jgi:hypothetical protein
MLLPFAVMMLQRATALCRYAPEKPVTALVTVVHVYTYYLLLLVQLMLRKRVHSRYPHCYYCYFAQQRAFTSMRSPPPPLYRSCLLQSLEEDSTASY